MRETVTKTKLKKNQKGITLIALVITIIVLLILAGVAISMLSGENGILKQAASAKVETEEAQEAENRQLKSMEMIMDIQQSNNNSQIRVSNGFITNIEPTTKVGEMVLPEGYSIYPKEGIGDNPVDNSVTVTTGMIVSKNGEEMSRIVIYGDVDCDGVVDSVDSNFIYTMSANFEYKLVYPDYQKIAADVNGDNSIDFKDSLEITAYSVGRDNDIIIDRSAGNAEKIKFGKSIAEDVTAGMKEGSPYKFEYDEETESYILTGIEIGTDAGDILEQIPGLTIYDGETEEEKVSGDVIENGDIFECNIEYKGKSWGVQIFYKLK